MKISKTCKICNHKDRKVIEYLISSGAPRDEILEKFGVNRVNIFNHKDHGLAPEIPQEDTTTWDLIEINVLERICAESGLSHTQVLDELLHCYGDRLRTKYNRLKHGITADDFRESDGARQYRNIMKLNRT